MILSDRHKNFGKLMADNAKRKKAARDGQFRTHGGRNTLEYRTWQFMKQRCHNPNAKEFKRYGAVGIVVCEEWRKSFEAFFAYMGPRPTPKHTIDRWPNGHGNYEPGNVRWATMAEQSRNKPNYNVMLTFSGETLPVVDWATKLGMNAGAIYQRIDSGWSTERTLTEPVHFGARPGRKYSEKAKEGLRRGQQRRWENYRKSLVVK